MSSSAPITTRAHLVQYSDRFVQPPTNLYVDPDDRLYIEHISNFVGLEFHVAARMLKPGGEGEIIHQEFQLKTSESAFQWEFEVFPLMEGFILGVAVHPTILVTGPGELYVLVGLLRGTDVRQSATQILCAGYVEGPAAPSWPAGKIDPPSSGRGRSFQQLTVDPAPGNEIVFTLAQNQRALLTSMRYTLVTSAAAANRRSIVEWVRGGVTLLRAPAQIVQTASLSFNYNVARWGMDGDNRDGEIMLNWPAGIMLEADDVIQTTTPGLQAGDDYSDARFILESWMAEF